MSKSVTCDDCQNPVLVTAAKCRCGWINPSRKETMQRFVPSAVPSISFADAKRAYERVASGMKRLSSSHGFDAISQWEKVLANPHAGTYAHMAAREALRTLGRIETREPGEDREERMAT